MSDTVDVADEMEAIGNMLKIAGWSMKSSGLRCRTTTIKAYLKNAFTL